MSTTRATSALRAEERKQRAATAGRTSRNAELGWLLAGSLVIGIGLWLVYAAKMNRLNSSDHDGLAGQVLNLNELPRAAALIPFLQSVSGADDQEFIARRIYQYKSAGGVFDNDGAIARMRVDESEIARVRGLEQLPRQFAEVRRRRADREEARQQAESRLGRWRDQIWPPKERAVSAPLVTAAEFAAMKPHLVVRSRQAFRREFLVWAALFFIAFYALHAFWRVRKFSGDPVILPVLQVLCGLGLLLMVSLRDPVRDTLMFTDFSAGVAAGCAAMALFSVFDMERLLGRLSWVPLLGAVLLAAALGLFGSGPGLSDAKVNLLHFQPMEAIRILLVLFLAGYFARNWDALRQLRQKQGRLAGLAERVNIPRLDYLLPVLLGVAISIALFFWLSDLGPALVIGCLFLTLYSVARKRVALAAAGLAAIVLAFAVGYAIGYPHTVRERVDMWRAPWNNTVRGGDQVAESLWALATGGSTGTGLGLGEPGTLPAGHTDLVLAGLGEQVGFIGLTAIFLLYGVLVYRGFRAGLGASDAYGFFLAVGLTLIAAYELLLISGGLLGLIPLSGVVSPFLSYGRTSMVANFVLFAMVLSVSSRSVAGKAQEQNFGPPTRVLAGVLGGLFVIVLARAAWVQIVRGDEVLVKGTLATQADGVRRYQYNPRLQEAVRLIPQGTIVDRNGLPLATSDWNEVEKHRQDYQKLGVTVAAAPSGERRYYPLGPEFFYLLGDVRTRLKQGATNTAFAESESRVRLQGFDDVAETEEVADPETGVTTARVRRNYRALIPLLRHRWEPANPQVLALMNQHREVRMAVNAALQERASAILRDHLRKLGNDKGAVVILDPATGELLASVSYPWPSADQFESLRSSSEAPLPDHDLLDRARFGLYPPGSSFKIVTAVAALRKNPDLANEHFECIRLPDGRTGNYVGKRMIRDDERDTQPHGSVDMQKGITVSCNAYFAQLGAERVGAKELFETAAQFGISVAAPNTPEKLQQSLPQASYGQGQVVASPFQMARVAAAIANGGESLQGNWILDESNERLHAPVRVLDADLAAKLGTFMRAVVTSGTGRVLSKSAIPIAGKTGTAELAKAPSDAWFIGYAPYGVKSGKQIAFAVLVENGQYGGTAAAPIAGDLVAAARQLGII